MSVPHLPLSYMLHANCLLYFILTMHTFWLISCTRVHTHIIMYALPGFFHDMFPHLSIYPCVRGLSFLYLLLNNNKCFLLTVSPAAVGVH